MLFRSNDMEPLLVIPVLLMLAAAIGKRAGSAIPYAHPVLFFSAFCWSVLLMLNFPEGHAVSYPWFHAGSFDFRISLSLDGIERRAGQQGRTEQCSEFLHTTASSSMPARPA